MSKLASVIERDHPENFPSFVVSVYSGMRLGEQFSIKWNQVDFKRQVIRLTKTKNGSARNVPLNSIALAATRSQWAMVPHGATDPVFPALRANRADLPALVFACPQRGGYKGLHLALEPPYVLLMACDRWPFNQGHPNSGWSQDDCNGRAVCSPFPREHRIGIRHCLTQHAPKQAPARKCLRTKRGIFLVTY